MKTRRIIRSNYDYLKMDFPDETLHKMCYGKIRYRNQEEVDNKIKEIQLERPKTKLRTYECPICAGIHLTHLV